MKLTINHDAAKKEFSATLGDKAALLKYTTGSDKNVLNYVSTFVPPEFRGQHIGEQLVKYALDYARKNNYKIIPTCPFVQRVLDQNPEYKDIVVE